MHMYVHPQHSQSVSCTRQEDRQLMNSVHAAALVATYTTPDERSQQQCKVAAGRVVRVYARQWITHLFRIGPWKCSTEAEWQFAATAHEQPDALDATGSAMRNKSNFSTHRDTAAGTLPGQRMVVLPPAR
jgi:hypothetical protein